ncbi:MAG: hypothetical protein E6Q37_00145 [Crocinitomicaceae bacterium]|nr:MAG: hypothetical protein E6Q37_00145 [Crocinitomicaceae bacterium]
MKNRFLSPTPKFFRIVRNIGIGLAAAGGVILASPVVLPAAVISLGSYLILGGMVASAVAQSVEEVKK